MRESFLFRLASDPPARLWSGVGLLPIDADFIEDEDAVYLGAGEILDFPDFDQLVNGVAQRIDFKLSGVSATAYALAKEDAPSVKGARVDIGIIQFDDDWQPLGPPVWEAEFRADSLILQSDPSDTGRTLSVTLSVGSDDTGRSRAPVSFWTAADQNRVSPTDAFFDHVAGINQGTTRRFAPK